MTDSYLDRLRVFAGILRRHVAAMKRLASVHERNALRESAHLPPLNPSWPD